MEEISKLLHLDNEEINWLYKDLEEIGFYNILKIINLLIKNGVDVVFIKEILFNQQRVLKMDYERIEYIIDSIIANDDIIEETLLELV